MRCSPTLRAVLAAGLLVSIFPFLAEADGSTIDSTTHSSYYQLYVDQSLPTPTQASLLQAGRPQVVANIIPPAGIVPTANNGSPLAVLKSLPGNVDPGKSQALGALSGTSGGFDPTNLAVLLSPDNSQLGLIFFGQGLQGNNHNGQGGLVDFSVAVKNGLGDGPKIQSTDPNVHIIGPLPLIDPPPPPPPLPPPPPTSTPSPTPTPTPVVTHLSAPPAPSPLPQAPPPAPAPPPSNTPEPVSLAIWAALGGLGLARMRSRRRAA